MDITLDKIELVKERTGVSYRQAKEALTEAEGSVVDAIILIEEEMELAPQNRTEDELSRIVDAVKNIVKKGNVSKIVVKKDGKTVLNIPVNLGIAGVLITPWGMLIAAMTAIGTRCTVDIVKDDGDVINVSEMTYSTISEAREKSGDAFSSVREMGGEAISSMKDMMDSDTVVSMMEKGGEAISAVKDRAADVIRKVRQDGVDFTDGEDLEVEDDPDDITVEFKPSEEPEDGSKDEFFDDDYFNFDDFDEGALGSDGEVETESEARFEKAVEDLRQVEESSEGQE